MSYLILEKTMKKLINSLVIATFIVGTIMIGIASAENSWNVTNFVDEFGDETEDKVLRSRNVIIHDQNTEFKSSINILMDYNEAAFFINHVRFSSSGEMLVAKNKAGERLELPLYALWPRDKDGWAVDGKQLANFLKKSIGIVKFIIHNRRYSSSYHFSIDSTGFTKAYNQAFVKEIEAEKIEAKRIENEKIEAEKIEAEKIEAKRIENEKLMTKVDKIIEKLDAEVEAERIKTAEEAIIPAPLIPWVVFGLLFVLIRTAMPSQLGTNKGDKAVKKSDEKLTVKVIKFSDGV